ncbi:MAG: condensation domain-containing protein, partial [Bacteroidota bacterium]
ASYHFAESYLIDGALDVEQLVEALKSVIRRHEILRTVFREVDDVRQQVILERETLNYQAFDFRGRERALADARAKIKEESIRPFDLENGPTSRLIIIQTQDAQYLVLLALHHMLMDHQSMQILREEWAAFYRASQHGPAYSPEPLKLQYGDYAYQQDAKSPLDGAIEFWRSQLNHAPTLSDLPTDFAPKSRFSYQGKFVTQDFPAAQTDAVYQFLQENSCTLYQLFVVAFKILIWQRSGQKYVNIGSPVSNRNRSELDPLIGYFNDTIVLTDELKADESFSSLLSRFKANFLESFARKDVPFDELVKALQPKRIPGRNPYFQHMVVMQK